MKKNLVYLLLLVAANCLGQAPVINDVQPLNAGPNQKIVITGNGFSATLAQNLVWFDHVPGTVTAATIYSLEVQVPARARFSNVEVTNTSTGLSTKSKLKFLPSYGGPSFDITKTKLVKVDSSTLEFFDIASADFDMDGDLDMVSTRGGPTSTAPITDIYVHQNGSTGIGNIKFTRTSLTVGFPTANVACGDLNGDGKPDIVTSRGGTTRNEIFVLKNTNSVAGTLSFAPKVTLLLDPSQAAFRISIRDLDGNGKPELIVSNAYDDNVSTTDNQIYVFPNTSSGATISFGVPIKLNVTGALTTYGLDVQDLDGDSKPDIIVNQFQSQDIFIFRNTSSGSPSFAPVQNFPAPAGKFNNITTCDLNKDGLLDLIATSTLSDQIQVWINSSTPGNINFPAAGSTTFASSRGPWGIDVTDIDGDGDADIVVTNINGVGPRYDPTDINLNIFRQDGLLTFTRLDFKLVDLSRNVRVGDYDGDGKPDIAFTQLPTSGTNNRLTLIRNSNCWAPVITGPSTKICIGQTIPLQTKPALGVTYDWKIGAASQGVNTNTFSATVAGTYSVTLTGTFDTGCANKSPDYVLTADNTNAFPTDPTIGNNTPCLGQPLNLSVATGNAAGATYNWTGPNNYTASSADPTTTVVIPSATFQNAGVYSLQVVLSTGCKSNVVTKQLDVASVPVLPVSTNPAIGCVGGSVTLSVSGSGYTFKWNKGGTAISPAETNASLVLNSLTAANEADYSVVVTSIANGCSQETAKTNLQVFAPPVPNFSVSAPTCKGSVISFTDQTPAGDARGTFAYAWTFGDATSSTLQSPTHAYATANGFSVSLTVNYTTATGCSGNVTKPLTVIDASVPTITPSATPICSGDATSLSITGSYTSITWSGGVTGSTSSVNVTQPGVLYKVKTTDANGCTAKDSITIPSKPLITPFTVKAGRSTISSGDTTLLTATTGADSYLWDPAVTLSNAAISNPIAKPESTTKYAVVAKKAGSCDAHGEVTVNVPPENAIINPPVLFSPNGDTHNDVWKLCYNPSDPTGPCAEETKYVDYTMTIFDGHGSMVFQKKGFTQWDGGSAPDGVYYYVFSNSHGKPATGSVLLVRQKQ